MTDLVRDPLLLQAVKIGENATLGDLNIFEKIAEIRRTWEASLDFFAEAATSMGSAMSTFYDLDVNSCGNRRVAHLAKYGRKARTRKKNKNRAFKMIEPLT